MRLFLLAHGATGEDLGFNVEMMLIGGAAAAMALKLRSDRQGSGLVVLAMLFVGAGLVIASFFVH